MVSLEGVSKLQVWKKVKYGIMASTFKPLMCRQKKVSHQSICKTHGGGRFSHWHGIRVYVPTSLGAILWNLVRQSVDFLQRWKSPNYMNWVYFEQIMVKSTQFEQNWVLFFWNWYTDWWIIVRKIWYRESQMFEIRLAHPRTILAKVPLLVKKQQGEELFTGLPNTVHPMMGWEIRNCFSCLFLW